MTDDRTCLRPDADGYYHPSNEEEICSLIRYAASHNLQVRVRGSAHSIAKAIYADGSSIRNSHDAVPNDQMIHILLDRMRKVVVHQELMQVTVEAGCHLGVDPNDPSGTSSLYNSLCRQLDELGWALPDLGGVDHQTVAGFIATGSSGGSIKHSIYDAIVKLRLIDGTGKVHEVSPDDHADLFYAAGVSLGLLGIITSVTFQCVDRYDLKGQEAITHIEKAQVQLFDQGERGVASFYQRTDYSRMLWWPQAGVGKLVVWQAQRIYDRGAKWKRKPYKEVPWIFGSPTLVTWVGGMGYTLLGRWRTYVKKLLRDGVRAEKLIRFMSRKWEPWLARTIINAFTPVDKKDPQRFEDTWWQGLPLDNQIEDRLLPTDFTELFIPLEQSAEVLRCLKAHYEENGLRATGTYACEIYAAKRSPFWLSPAYGEDMVRIDIFWFRKNDRDPVKEFYPQFWELLKRFNYRLHWGKFLPDDPAMPAYLRSVYPRWDDFMRLRNAMDPDQRFVTSYWRQCLGIPHQAEQLKEENAS